MSRPLHEVMAALYAAELNCGCQSFWDGGFTVWLGDPTNGRTAQADFHFGAVGFPDFSTAGDWLWAQAVAAFPGLADGANG